MDRAFILNSNLDELVHIFNSNSPFKAKFVFVKREENVMNIQVRINLVIMAGDHHLASYYNKSAQRIIIRAINRHHHHHGQIRN